MKKTFNNKVCYYEAAREISFEETSIPPLQKCALPNFQRLRQRERERTAKERHKQTEETFLVFCMKELRSIFAALLFRV